MEPKLSINEDGDLCITIAAQCRTCNYYCHTEVPMQAPLHHLECPNCHAMTLEIED